MNKALGLAIALALVLAAPDVFAQEKAVFYEDVGQIKLGDYNTLDVARRELRGEFRTAPRLYFWNSWLAR